MLENILIRFSKKRGMNTTIQTLSVTPVFAGGNRTMADERFAAHRRL
jgi:hypothetical protein